MIGGTAREASLFLDDDAVWHRTLTEDRNCASASPQWPASDADAALALYREKSARREPGDRLIAALTGSNFSVRTWLYAERRAARANGKSIAPTYHYSLDWARRSPAGGWARTTRWTCRSCSTRPRCRCRPRAPTARPSWRRRCRRPGRNSPAPAARQRGDPRLARLYAGERATMVFDTRCRVVNDPDREARLLWSRVATRA
jgi:carboxylesterase type B